MVQGSSHYPGDAGMSPEFSDAEQKRARAKLAAEYQQVNRSPLSEEERKEREGFFAPPLTPEMRTMLAHVIRLRDREYTAYLLLAPFACIGAPLLTQLLFARSYLTVLVGVATIALLVGLYRVIARRTRARRIARVNRLQSYYRYAGPCETQITETSWSRWMGSGPGPYSKGVYRYTFQLDSPPVPAELSMLRWEGSDEHVEWRGVQWYTLEFIGSGNFIGSWNDVLMLSIKDDRDQVIYTAPRIM